MDIRLCHVIRERSIERHCVATPTFRQDICLSMINFSKHILMQLSLKCITYVNLKLPLDHSLTV
jgi:hypothetical protein